MDFILSCVYWNALETLCLHCSEPGLSSSCNRSCSNDTKAIIHKIIIFLSVFFSFVWGLVNNMKQPISKIGQHTYCELESQINIQYLQLSYLFSSQLWVSLLHGYSFIYLVSCLQPLYLQIFLIQNKLHLNVLS